MSSRFLVFAVFAATTFALGCSSTPTTAPGSPTLTTPVAGPAEAKLEPESTPATAAKSLPRQPKNPSKSSHYVQCNGERVRIDRVLLPLVDELVAQKIPYAQYPSEEWRDCSGNFLRLSSYFANACPDQMNYLAAPPGIKAYRPGQKNQAPGTPKSRSSLGIAKWYHSQNRFSPIFYDGVSRPGQASDDLIKVRNKIAPGTVLWFARSPTTSKSGTNALLNPNHPGHINHMATVTEVEKDKNGNLIRLSMYHGQSKNKMAKVTTNHFWTWPERLLKNKKREYPPLGYWDQYLVGIASLIPASK